MIDTSLDFTTDTEGFWDGFWYRKGGLGYCGNGPDSFSARLREYHRILWSRELPNGQVMGPISCLLLAFYNRSVLNLPGSRTSVIRFVFLVVSSNLFHFGNSSDSIAQCERSMMRSVCDKVGDRVPNR